MKNIKVSDFDHKRIAEVGAHFHVTLGESIGIALTIAFGKDLEKLKNYVHTVQPASNGTTEGLNQS